MYLKRSLILTLPIIFIVIGCGPKFEGTFSYTPEKPQAGDEITVMYDPAGTPLESTDNIDMVAYLYSVDLDDAVGIEMEKEGKGYKASFNTLPTTRGVIVKFVDRADYEKADINDKEGYLIKIYDKDGNVIAGSRAGLAGAYYLWSSAAGIERNGEKSISEYNKAFAENTDVKHEYLDSYFNVLMRVNPDEADSIITNELEELQNKTDLTEKDLGVLAKWFQKVGLADKAEQYKKLSLEKYPEGEFAQEIEMENFNNAKSGADKVAAMEAFSVKFPESKLLNNMYNTIVYTFRQEGNYEAAYEFMKKHPQSIHPFYYQYTAEKMIKENVDPNLTMQIVEEGVKQAQLNADDPYTEKPNGQTVKEWQNSNDYYLGLNQYLYGKLLFEQGSVQKAISILEKAIENTDKLYNEQELKEFYAKALIEAGEYQKAMNAISSFIEEGDGSDVLQDDLKTAYVKQNGSEEGFSEYLAQFTSAAEEEMLNELKENMINETAPKFTLADLDGNEISLEDYKGKTVVIDFWATWCGPCLQSFPAMKTAVENYKNDDSVSFLFINTWERVENKKENAVNFIKENNYPFHVLLDLDNDVITKYKVEGIPTKFVIDPNQNIRFKSVGFSGNIDQMVKELEVMIELTRS